MIEWFSVFSYTDFFVFCIFPFFWYKKIISHMHLHMDMEKKLGNNMHMEKKFNTIKFLINKWCQPQINLRHENWRWLTKMLQIAITLQIMKNFYQKKVKKKHLLLWLKISKCTLYSNCLQKNNKTRKHVFACGIIFFCFFFVSNGGDIYNHCLVCLNRKGF